MRKPSASIGCSDEIQSGGNGLLERFRCASTCPPQHALQFGEGFFNGRQIRRVGRQKQQATADRFNGVLDPRSQMNREIIEDHDLPGMQAGGQHLLDVEFKGRPIGRSVQQERFAHPRQRQAGDQRSAGAVVARHFADGALPFGGVGIQGGHGDMGTGLIHKDQLAAWQVSRLGAPSGTLDFLLLACSQRLFFRVQPRAALARLILAVLTLTPVRSSQRRQCSSRVASGYCSNCSKRPACNAAPFTAGRPGIALGTR
jgi:hypothetical protein